MNHLKEEKLTYEELHRVLDYNPLTGILKWKIRPACCIHIGDIAGCSDSNGYIIIHFRGYSYKAHRLAWFHYYGYMPENIIDHRDRIEYHNWILNLREVSQQCNVRNIGNYKHNTSGVKGVYWLKNDKKWRANLTVKGKAKVLGQFKTFDEAVCHRLAGEQCVDWSNCDSSSPAYQYVKNNIQKEFI